LGDRLRVPMEERELALLVCRCREGIAEAAHAAAAEQLGLLKRADAFRRKERFEELLLAARLAEPAVAAGAERARSALRAAAAIDAGVIAGKAASPSAIAAAIDAARLEAVGKAMKY
jgi:tRNA nucleotidyltransferase (CCA-adding enzyme)